MGETEAATIHRTMLLPCSPDVVCVVNRAIYSRASMLTGGGIEMRGCTVMWRVDDHVLFPPLLFLLGEAQAAMHTWGAAVALLPVAVCKADAVLSSVALVCNFSVSLQDRALAPVIQPASLQA